MLVAEHYLKAERHLYPDQTAQIPPSEVRELAPAIQPSGQRTAAFDAAVIESQPVLLAPPEKQHPLQRDSRPMRKQASQDSLSVLALVSGGAGGHDVSAGTSLGEGTAPSPAPSPALVTAPLLATRREPTGGAHVLQCPEGVL